MKAVPLHDNPPPSPVHVAIIMDGNGRWATARGLPRAAGHRQGAEAVRTAVKSAIEAGVAYLTLYGFSSENWSRPPAEVSDLMGLLRYYLRSEIAKLCQDGIRLRVIGERERLDHDIVALIEEAEKATAGGRRLTLTLALSYGGRAEIAWAARHLAEKVAVGNLRPEKIDEAAFEACLFTAGIPDPDLIVRTSGEKRISNFLLWQMAYSEFVFVDTLWPDFSQRDFQRAVADFRGRDRRYGSRGE